jgi:signal transduction histidine kinase
MNTTRALRLRLIAIYVGVLFAGLLCFAAAAVYGIDRSERNGLDGRLSATAQAISGLLDLSSGQPVIDRDDRRQFISVLGPQAGGLIADLSRNVVLSNASDPPDSVLSVPPARTAFFDAGKGEEQIRAFVLPVSHNGRIVGKVVVWRPSDWIDETDRGLAIAFLLAAMIIAGLAWVAGSAVTHRALEEAVSRQRRFTADASHDLRAPLAVIRAEADLALSRERDAGAYRTAIATISDEAGRMEELIGDLLSAARAEAGALEQTVIDLDEAARGVCARISAAAAAKNISLDLTSTPTARVLGDARELERAILAVLHNAVKHAPDGGHIEVRVAVNGPMVELAIRDDGPGFSPDALEHGLERFWRDEAPGPDRGSGLGLALTDSIARAFGGRVRLANVGRWAETRIIFPAV